MGQQVYSHAYHLARLTDQLLTTLPALQGAAGTMARVEVQPQGTAVLVRWADDTGVTEAEIAAVVAAHNPDMPSAVEQGRITQRTHWADLRDAAAQMITRASQIETQMNGSPTNAQVIAAVKDLAIGMRRLTRAVAYIAQREAAE